MTDVFVYGTLSDADRAADLLDDFAYEGNATLEGLQRFDGGDYPTLVPGGSVDGRILRTLTIDRLDAYEGVDRGLYVRVTVPTAEGDAVETYVGDPAELGVAADWPGEGTFADRVEDYVADGSVRVIRNR
ncbi:gamma-glutamylcyclotransferase [Halobacteriales archaeon Cl-PHB]